MPSKQRITVRCLCVGGIVGSKSSNWEDVLSSLLEMIPGEVTLGNPGYSSRQSELIVIAFSLVDDRVPLRLC